MKLIALSYLLMAGLVLAQDKGKLPPPTFPNVSYGPHERNKLDVWQAKGDGVTPLVIFIHGGGWAGGDKADVPPTLLKTMLAQGVSVASINYRYSTIAILPAPVHDAARSVQFLRSKAAEWKLDAWRFGAYGISAGATTTLWLACHDDLVDPKSNDSIAQESSRLQAGVGLSPQTSLEPEVMVGWVGEEVLLHPMISRAVGAAAPADVKRPKAEWLKLWHEFSPITHVSADDPPTLISNPRVDPLPAATPGSAIHHALFGVKFQEKVKAVGGACILRIQEQPTADVPTPEEFLVKQLGHVPQ